MNWKFWQREKSNNNTGIKLPGPKDLPQQIGMYLVVQERMEPDYVWMLKCVVRPRPERKGYFDFRIYDPNQVHAANVRIINYNSLEDHPELIVVKGRYDKNNRDPELDKTSSIPTAA